MEQALAKGKNYVLLLVEKNPMLMVPPSLSKAFWIM
jgi:hypothetical protein